MNSVTASPDVLVIGAGVIGLATAYELLCAGLRVRVLERGAVGPGGASWAGGGILAPLEPATLDPGVLPQLRDSLAVYADWCAQVHEDGGVDPEYLVSGLRVLAPHEEVDWRVWAARCGLEVEAAAAHAAFGHRESAALDLPAIAQVRSPRLLRALAAAVRARGGEIIEHQPVRKRTKDGVVTDGGTHRAAHTVLAAGAWSTGLEPAAAVTPVKGEMLLFAPLASASTRILLHHDMYLIPRRDGCIVAGSTLESVGFDAQPSAAGRERILSALGEFAPELARQAPIGHWAGLRPCPTVGAGPHLGWCESSPGLLLNCGHYRLGITLAPGSARVVRNLILRGR